MQGEIGQSLQKQWREEVDEDVQILASRLNLLAIRISPSLRLKCTIPLQYPCDQFNNTSRPGQRVNVGQGGGATLAIVEKIMQRERG